MKIVSKLGKEGTVLNLITGVSEEPPETLARAAGILKAFLDTRNRERTLPSHARGPSQSEAEKEIRLGRTNIKCSS